MKAYKVVWKSFEQNHGFSIGSSSSSSGFSIRTYDKFFGTKEAAEEFLKKKNDAAQELNLLVLLGRLEEVELD